MALKWDEMSPKHKGELVAEKVMGWHQVREEWGVYWYEDKQRRCEISNWQPDSDIVDAWTVATKSGEIFSLFGHEHTGWKASFGNHSAAAWLVTDAICKAALRAKGVDV